MTHRRLPRGMWSLGLPLLAGLLPTATEAQVSGEIDYATTYLFAGVPFAAEGDGDVSRGTLSYELTDGFSLNGFAVWDIGTTQFSEADIYGEYSGQAASRVGYYVGAVLYNFLINDEWDQSYEVYAGATLDAPLSPTVHVAHDFELGDGTRAYLQLSQGFPLGPSGSRFNLSGRVEYNDSYYTRSSGFAYADVVGSLEFNVGAFTLVPALTIQRQLDNAFTGFIDDEEVFSIAAAFAF